MFWYLPRARSASHRSLPNQACFEKANFEGKAKAITEEQLMSEKCLDSTPMPWTETEVFTKVPQLIWTRPLETCPRSCLSHVSKKRKGAARSQRLCERTRSLELISCRLAFPLRPHPPPWMPCHSCLAIVEQQQQQLLLYSRLAKSLIFARVRQVSRLPRQHASDNAKQRNPDLQKICQMNRRMKCQTTVHKKGLIECQDLCHIESELFCQSECWIECLNLPKTACLNLCEWKRHSVISEPKAGTQVRKGVRKKTNYMSECLSKCNV